MYDPLLWVVHNIHHNINFLSTKPRSWQNRRHDAHTINSLLHSGDWNVIQNKCYILSKFESFLGVGAPRSGRKSLIRQKQIYNLQTLLNWLLKTVVIFIVNTWNISGLMCEDELSFLPSLDSIILEHISSLWHSLSPNYVQLIVSVSQIMGSCLQMCCSV